MLLLTISGMVAIATVSQILKSSSFPLVMAHSVGKVHYGIDELVTNVQPDLRIALIDCFCYTLTRLSILLSSKFV